MTLREAIVRRKRRGSIAAFLGVAWFAIWMVLSRAEAPWLFVAFLGVAVVYAGMLYTFLLRCPRCRGRIGYTVSYWSGPFSISRKVRFCPFCGIALDSELDGRRVV